MIKTLNTYEAADMLHDDENANWSRGGSLALAEHLEEYEESTGEQIELDVVALRCDYSEYESPKKFITDYYGSDLETCLKLAGIDLDVEDPDVDDLIESFIEDHGILIKFNGGIIVSSF